MTTFTFYLGFSLSPNCFLEPGWQKFASEAAAANHTLWAQQISQRH